MKLIGEGCLKNYGVSRPESNRETEGGESKLWKWPETDYNRQRWSLNSLKLERQHPIPCFSSPKANLYAPECDWSVESSEAP